MHSRYGAVMIDIGPYRFTATDSARTLANLGTIWTDMTAGLSAGVVDDIAAEAARRLAEALGTTVGAGTSIEALGRLGERAARSWESLGHDDGQHVLADQWAAWSAAQRRLREVGALAVDGSGTVANLAVSAGGVPKVPVDDVEVTWSGLRGDRQGSRYHHGRPWQALCLWSSEVIAELAAAGHPLAPGRAGENITITGLDWAQVRPGVRLRVGSVLAETSAWALPCKQNRDWFLDGDFSLMHHQRGPVSRIYATVIEPGHITVGDAVTLVA